jgi:hypothetical protein
MNKILIVVSILTFFPNASANQPLAVEEVLGSHLLSGEYSPNISDAEKKELSLLRKYTSRLYCNTHGYLEDSCKLAQSHTEYCRFREEYIEQQKHEQFIQALKILAFQAAALGLGIGLAYYNETIASVVPENVAFFNNSYVAVPLRPVARITLEGAKYGAFSVGITGQLNTSTVRSMLRGALFFTIQRYGAPAVCSKVNHLVNAHKDNKYLAVIQPASGDFALEKTQAGKAGAFMWQWGPSFVSFYTYYRQQHSQK